MLSPACRKLPVEPADIPVCEEIPPSTSPFGYSFDYPDFTFSSAVFNPGNSEQIAYARYDQIDNESELWVWDQSSGEAIPLASNITGRPVWSVSNWIFFASLDKQIYKVRPGGDSLSRLTHDNWNRVPACHPNGDQLLFFVDNSPEFYTRIINIEGELIDSVYELASSNVKWSPNGTHLTYISSDPTLATHGFYEFDLTTRQTELLFLVPSQGRNEDIIRQYEWLPGENKIMFTREKDISIGDVETGEITPVLEGCDTRKFNDLALSPDGQRFLSTWILSEVLNGAEMFVDIKIAESDIEAMVTEFLEPPVP